MMFLQFNGHATYFIVNKLMINLQNQLYFYNYKIICQFLFYLQKILESKRDKLREQLEEAKKLKESIDRRSVNVSNILYKYFNSEEYADYDHFINMKAKLIMDSREIADKIKLGEEQLAALRETLSAPD